MNDESELERVIKLGRVVVSDEKNLEEMREWGLWMLYMLWKSDPEKPSWYGADDELERFQRGPNPFDPPVESDV